jgi:hypothetical protein
MGRAPLLFVEEPGGTIGDFDLLYVYLPNTKALTQVEKGNGLSYQGNGRFAEVGRSGTIGFSSHLVWNGQGLASEGERAVRVGKTGKTTTWVTLALDYGLRWPLLNADELFQNGAAYEQCKSAWTGTEEVAKDQPSNGDVLFTRAEGKSLVVQLNESKLIAGCKVQ